MPAPLISGLDPAALLGLGASETSSAEWEPPSPAEVAKLFPQWQMKGLLGHGGMGAVYHLHQPDLDRDVAIKLLPIEASRDEHQVERFRREARTLAKLRHPGIVALHESGITPAGHFYFVMEHVDGCPLNDLIAASKLDVPRAIEVVRQVCDALAYAHEQGVIHRDIKPSNILIDSAGQVKVADFGLARLDRASDSDAMTLSHTGAFMGTPAYTAPEQARDAAHVDHRADLYSLGVLLYEMLTGELPRGVFQPPSRKAGSDARLDDVVQRALQERPEDRYQAAADIKRDVTRVGAPASPAKATRSLPWAAIIALLLLAGSGVVWHAWHTAGNIPEAMKHQATLGQSSPTTKTKFVTSDARADQLSPAPPTAAAVTRAETKAVPDESTAPMLPAFTKQSSDAPASGIIAASTAKVHVWSIDPVSPALYPPKSLTDLEWLDAALLSNGGAVLLKSGEVVLWSESSPEKEWRMAPFDNVIMIEASPNEAVALGINGTAWRLEPGGIREARSIGRDIQQLFPSAKPKVMSALSNSGSMVLLTLDERTPQRMLPALQGTNPRQAVLNSDGLLWVTSTDRRVWRYDTMSNDGFQLISHTNIERLAAMGMSVFGLKPTGEIVSLDGTSPPSALPSVKNILAVTGMALAYSQDTKAMLWGPQVTDSPQRFRLPEGTTHVRLGPTGLMAAW